MYIRGWNNYLNSDLKFRSYRNLIKYGGARFIIDFSFWFRKTHTGCIWFECQRRSHIKYFAFMSKSKWNIFRFRCLDTENAHTDALNFYMKHALDMEFLILQTVLELFTLLHFPQIRIECVNRYLFNIEGASCCLL